MRQFVCNVKYEHQDVEGATTIALNPCEPAYEVEHIELRIS